MKVLQTGLETIKKNAALTSHQSIFLHEVTRLSANMKEGVPTVMKEVILDQLYETLDKEDRERDHVAARELMIESFEETIPEINLVAASSGYGVPHRVFAHFLDFFSRIFRAPVSVSLSTPSSPANLGLQPLEARKCHDPVPHRHHGLFFSSNISTHALTGSEIVHLGSETVHLQVG